MSKQYLTTTDGVLRKVMGLTPVNSGIRARETAAYIAECVKFYQQTVDESREHWKRTYENERLRVAFDALVVEGERPQGWARFDGINHERDFEHLRDAMKGEDK